MRTILAAVILAAPAGLLIAQDLDPIGGTAEVATASDYTPLNLGQSYAWSTSAIFGPVSEISIVAHAGLDQIGKHSDGWGSTAPNYGIRTASWLGHSFVRENLAYGVRAIDGEDPRYFRLGNGSVGHRAKYAFSRTFITRGRSGESMPAFSLAADFATPFIAHQWHAAPLRVTHETG